MFIIFKRISLVIGIELVLLSPLKLLAMGPIQNNSDPTLKSSLLGDQKISGRITLIETAYRCLTIDRGNGDLIRVVVDPNTRITRNGFVVDFRDLVAGNMVSIGHLPNQ